MSKQLDDKQYIAELEKLVIFLCDTYTKGQDSLVCQTDGSGQADEKWLNVMMAFPTIQGTMNRMLVRKIGNLRTHLKNREAVSVPFEELFERIKINRIDKDSKS